MNMGTLPGVEPQRTYPLKSCPVELQSILGELMPDRGSLPWEQRWTRPQYRSQPSPDTEVLVAALWPDDSFSDVFQVRAGYLLTARAEDGLPIPSGQDDPLVAQLARLISDDLQRAGLPEP
jgi:hypothetical protein